MLLQGINDLVEHNKLINMFQGKSKMSQMSAAPRKQPLPTVQASISFSNYLPDIKTLVDCTTALATQI